MSKKVLVFDNEKEELSKIQRGFLYKDFDVEVTMNAEEIISRSERMKPDIVILNSNVPGFDAFEVCELIKKSMDIPIILLLDKNSDSTGKIDDCTADAIVYKPVDFPHLIQSIKNVLQEA